MRCIPISKCWCIPGEHAESEPREGSYSLNEQHVKSRKVLYQRVCLKFPDISSYVNAVP